MAAAPVASVPSGWPHSSPPGRGGRSGSRRGLVRIAVALAGTAGARLSRGLGLAVSRKTRLRLRRQLSLPDVATPHVLGVDAWAVRKGRTSGTIFVDRERRRALARLPDREAKTVALWLPAHPGVGVITRDWSSALADGAQHGAPNAIQVADRLHVWQNLAEALDQVLHADGHALEAFHKALRQAPVTPPDGTVAVPVPPPAPPRNAQERAHQRQARRRALPQQIWAFHQPGWPVWAMAQPLGIGKHTVCRDLRTETLPARQRRTTAAAVCSPRTPPISSSAGTRVVVTPGGSSGSSNNGPPPAVMPRSRGTRATPPPAARNRAAAPRLDPAPGDLAQPATAGATDARGAGAAHATHRPGCYARRRDCTRPRCCPARAPAAASPAGPLAAVCERMARR